ncbi:hypothetical protein HELRODRAFT_173390 [Helobdella robusta]|uniref:Uncharacterized protein n=1 Tax=Helobdella robusta TaxID=6412 RepID=T1F6R6_HELRO|nr:hypothetical protein HELRODRAFT_173390 [Helobdella robusta]ESO03691.1 hypothetical protein HELRODRAFT_173390 [Helobdella robusta]
MSFTVRMSLALPTAITILDVKMLGYVLNTVDTVILSYDAFFGSCQVKLAREVIAKFSKSKKTLWLHCNNSLNSTNSIYSFLKKHSITDISKDHILCSNYVASQSLKYLMNFYGKVLVVGSNCLTSELQDAGIDCISLPDFTEEDETFDSLVHYEVDPLVNCVVIAADENFDYAKAAKTTAYLSKKNISYIVVDYVPKKDEGELSYELSDSLVTLDCEEEASLAKRSEASANLSSEDRYFPDDLNDENDEFNSMAKDEEKKVGVNECKASECRLTEVAFDDRIADLTNTIGSQRSNSQRNKMISFRADVSSPIDKNIAGGMSVNSSAIRRASDENRIKSIFSHKSEKDRAKRPSVNSSETENKKLEFKGDDKKVDEPIQNDQQQVSKTAESIPEGKSSRNLSKGEPDVAVVIVKIDSAESKHGVENGASSEKMLNNHNEPHSKLENLNSNHSHYRPLTGSNSEIELNQRYELRSNNDSHVKIDESDDENSLKDDDNKNTNKNNDDKNEDDKKSAPPAIDLVGARDPFNYGVTRCILKMISTTCGREPEYHIGLPEEFTLKVMAMKMKVIPEKILFITDRLHPDILFANRCSFHSLLITNKRTKFEEVIKLERSRRELDKCVL